MKFSINENSIIKIPLQIRITYKKGISDKKILMLINLFIFIYLTKNPCSHFIKLN